MRKYKRTNSMTFNKECPDCGAEVAVQYFPGNPPQTSGGPDGWYDGDPDGIDCATECRACSYSFTQELLDMWIEECCEEYNEYCEPPERERYDDSY